MVVNLEAARWICNSMGKAGKQPMKVITNTMTTHEELLDENARLRGDLLTIARRISHDLRTPLGAIISAGETMNEIVGQSDPTALSLVAASLGSADELSRLIKRVSFILKATALPSISERVAMAEPVSSALQRLENQMIKVGALVSQPESWPVVSGVSAWLEEVWWNLLSNAFQHGRAHPRVELGWRKESNETKFWISDNGPGVPVEKRDKLFQPFHRLHSPDAGRGLGLSIVERLVALQGGGCGYESNPQGGACFFFTLS
jgi:signal transduction histidine kinase